MSNPPFPREIQFRRMIERLLVRIIQFIYRYIYYYALKMKCSILVEWIELTILINTVHASNRCFFSRITR
eukprot:COSAG02_NODE_11703_length_1671_cov_2.860687_2_plen_70_part_00